MALEQAQVEYDIGCEDIIARHGSVEGASLKVGQRDVRHGRPAAADREPQRQDDGAAGGVRRRPAARCSAAATPPARSMAGRRTAAKLPRSCRAGSGSRQPSVPAMLAGRGDERIRHRARQRRQGHPVPPPARGRRRRVLFCWSTRASTRPSAGTIASPAQGVEQWDLDTGKIGAYPVRQKPTTGVEAAFELPPCGSLLLFLSKKAQAAGEQARAEDQRDRGRRATLQIAPLEPNVLTLDYVDVTAGGETKKNALLLPGATSSPSRRTAWSAIRGTAPCSSRTS